MEICNQNVLKSIKSAIEKKYFEWKPQCVSYSLWFIRKIALIFAKIKKVKVIGVVRLYFEVIDIRI